MKIAFVFREIKKSSNTAYVPVILEYFKKKGHEVKVFAQNNEFDFEYEKLPSIGKNVILKEISTSIGSLLKIKRKNFDLIYSRAGTRYVLADIYSFHFLFGEWGGKGFVSTAFSLAEKFSFMAKNKYIISVSNLLKDAIIKNYKIPENRIRVIHNGVNTKIFNSKNKKTKKAKEIREKFVDGFEKIVIFVGAKPERKGLPYLLKAMKYVNNCKLLVIGLNKENENKYKKICNELKIEEKIKFLGFVSHDDLKYFYAASDIFVLPTFFDPCAVATLEAMASGCVPIDSIFNGSAELIIHGKNGFKIKNPENEKEIARYINLLVEDNNLFRKMQSNAIKTGEGRDLYVVAKEWEEYFKEVYERGRGS